MPVKTYDPFPVDLIAEQFLIFLYFRGGSLAPKKNINLIFDKKMRYQVEGDKGAETSGLYYIHTDGYAAGYARNFRTDEYSEWKFDIEALKAETKYNNIYKQAKTKEFRKYAQEIKAKHEAEEKSEKLKIIAEVRALWAKLPDLGGCIHPYLVNKSAGNYGLKVTADNKIVVPLKNINGEIMSVQYISADGAKRFYPGAPTGGAFFDIGLDKVSGNTPILLCEGYATGATLFYLTNCPTVCAMNCGNLIKIAPELRKKFPNNKIFVMADNDTKTQGNPGLTKAQEAVKKFRLDGLFPPQFESPDDGTDWNDFYERYGGAACGNILNDYIKINCLPADERDKFIKTKSLLKLGTQLDKNIQLPPIEYLAGMFPRRYINFLVAAPGVGKTLLIQKIASDASLGGNILNGVSFAHEPLKSVIFAGEAGEGILIRRAAATQWPADKTKVKIYDRDKAYREGMIFDLDTPEGLENVRTIIEAERPDMVFFDSFMSFYSADESKADVVNKTLQNVGRMAQDFNAAVICTHHLRKRKTRDQNMPITLDEVIGSSMLSRTPATVYAIDPMNDADADYNESKINLVKLLKTWGKSFSPFSFQIAEDEDERLDITIDLNPLHKVDAKKILADYIQRNYSAGEWFKIGDLQGVVDISDKHIRRCLMKLVEEGKLKQQGEKKGSEYALKGFYG